MGCAGFDLQIRPDLAGMDLEAFFRMTGGGRFQMTLDGFLDAPPLIDLERPFVNADHHKRCERLFTRATCAQILMLYRAGMMRRFRRKGKPQLTAWIEGCDQDVCVVLWELQHPEAVEPAYNPLLHKLVNMEDLLDTNNGAYPFSERLKMMGVLAWIFEPFTVFRKGGGMSRRNPDEYRSVIDDVGLRISAYMVGGDQPRPINVDFRYLSGGGTDWHVVEPQGAEARLGMLSKGLCAVMEVRQESAQGPAITLVRLMEGAYFPVEEMLPTLNQLERAAGTPSDDTWGGASNVIGSPRKQGYTRIDLSTLSEVVERHVRQMMERLGA